MECLLPQSPLTHIIIVMPRDSIRCISLPFKVVDWAWLDLVVPASAEVVLEELVLGEPGRYADVVGEGVARIG